MSKKSIEQELVQVLPEGDPLRKLKSWQRYHFRLTALYGSAIILSLVILGFNFYKSGVNAEKTNLQARLMSVVTSLSASIDGDKIEEIPLENSVKTALHNRIYKTLKEVANNDPDTETIYILRPTREPTKLRFFIDYVKNGDSGNPGEIYDATEIPVMIKAFSAPAVEDEPYTDEFGTTLSGYAPLMNSKGESIAIIGADVNASRLDLIKFNVMKEVGIAFGIAILLLGLVALIVAKNIRKPLNQIIDAAVAISRGNLNTRINLLRNDELGVMGEQINIMAEQLQEREFIRETFGRYVSEEIAKTLLVQNASEKLGGEERVVTVLFCDMRGYSTLSEQMPPAQIVNMLNQYLSAMTEIIDRHNGCIIEFIGDAIFAVFGAPQYIADHAEKAVRCAIDMRTRLSQLSQELQESGITRYWKSDEIIDLRARIGIHTGHVVAGNLGSSTRMKYAVIGDTVNVAARLEQMNKELGTDILLSRDVYSLLPEELAREMIKQGDHHVKGRQQSVSVYSVDKPKPKLTVLNNAEA